MFRVLPPTINFEGTSVSHFKKKKRNSKVSGLFCTVVVNFFFQKQLILQTKTKQVQFAQRFLERLLDLSHCIQGGSFNNYLDNMRGPKNGEILSTYLLNDRLQLLSSELIVIHDKWASS